MNAPAGAGPLAGVTGGPVRAAVLTVSDRAARGKYADRSGPALAERIERAGGVVIAREIVPDERAAIAAALRGLCGRGDVDLVVTTGGTGFATRDVTPEATRTVIEREAPGLAEVMRLATRARTPLSPLSRGICGLLGGTLIVNLPGSPPGAVECFEAILDLLPHAVAVLRGEGGGHPRPSAGADPGAAP